VSKLTRRSAEPPAEAGGPAVALGDALLVACVARAETSALRRSRSLRSRSVSCWLCFML